MSAWPCVAELGSTGRPCSPIPGWRDASQPAGGRVADGWPRRPSAARVARRSEHLKIFVVAGTRFERQRCQLIRAVLVQHISTAWFRPGRLADPVLDHQGSVCLALPVCGRRSEPRLLRPHHLRRMASDEWPGGSPHPRANTLWRCRAARKCVPKQARRSTSAAIPNCQSPASIMGHRTLKAPQGTELATS
jgi:hypothetical protein